MDPLPIALLVVGIVLLVGGAELLVSGAAGIARSLGIMPIVIGLTVVAFGTSAPEMAISVGASLAGEPDVAVGNVVGSNIYNVLLILGLSALAAPLLVDERVTRREVPLMVLASIGVALMAADGTLGRLDGLVLVAGLLAWIGWLLRNSRRSGRAVPVSLNTLGAAAGPARSGATRSPLAVSSPGAGGRGRAWQLGQIGIGLVILVAGAQAVVHGAIDLAYAVGLSPLVVGLTIVAVGTSLPELATSVAASLRGERAIAVGNVVGSNILNIGAVLGFTALFSPDGVAVAPVALGRDFPVMIGVALICVPLFFTGRGLARWEGGLLLGCGVVYTVFVLLVATEHPAVPALTTVLVGVALPAMAITLGALTVREMQARRAAR
ncbi:MAG TPA: calcium/sodium antiporter [Patescibacteria group bacterium]|nr:calcium/sodium antiporter [Patescibacteria group bacterium]